MMVRKYLALSALLACHLHAQSETKKPFFGNKAPTQPAHEKTDNLELMYVFNKSFIDKLDNAIGISNPFVFGSKTITPNFQWGEQGQITWTKKLSNSIYTLVTSFYALHNHYNFYTKEATPSIFGGIGLNASNAYFPSISVVSNSQLNPYTYSQHNQFNLFDLDLFVKADLKDTKHAKFSIYGGGIIAGYNFKSFQKGTQVQEEDQTTETQIYRMSNTDYYLGPNAKIHVAAPFFNNHVELSLRGGAGLMMSFNSLRAFKDITSPTYTSINSDSYGYSNTLRLAYQFDILAQVSFCYKDFCLASGITQFYYHAIKPDNTISFGGPFIKASYTF